MKKKTFTRLFAGAFAAAMLLTGCSQGTETSQESDEKKPLALLLSQEDEFLLDLKEAVEEEAKAQGYDLLYYSADGDAETQLRQMHEAYAAGAGTLIVNLTGDQVAEDIAETADTAVVLVNRAPNDRSILSENLVFVGCDESQCGTLQGEALAAYFAGKEGSDIRYLMFQGVPGLENTEKRTNGAVQALYDAGFNAIAADSYQVCGFFRGQAQKAMEGLLAKGTEYDCIICNNDAMALGVAAALKQAGVDVSQTPIVGMDNTPDGAAALAEGTLYMTIDQNAGEQTAAAVAAAVNLDQGRPFDENINIPKDQDGGNVQPYILRTPVHAVMRDN